MDGALAGNSLERKRAMRFALVRKGSHRVRLNTRIDTSHRVDALSDQ
jgi:hypothetical protein